MLGQHTRLVFSLATAILVVVVGTGSLPTDATAGPAAARDTPALATTAERPPASPPRAQAAVAAVRGHLEHGDRNLAKGRRRRARRQWVKALAAGGEVAFGAQERLRALSDAHEFPRWQRTVSEHFVLLTPRRAPPARRAARFLAGREAAYERIVTTLGVEPDGKITIFAYRSNRQAVRVSGRSLGFARPAEREIHIRHDQEPGHEEAHVIAWHWNRAGAAVPFLEEGLAVALSSHPGNPHASAVDALTQDRLPSLGDLITRFRAYRNGYILAGSFVSDVIERHGVDVIRQLYVKNTGLEFLQRLETATGESATQLQNHWEAVLAAQSSSNREELLEAISLQRRGRTEEAIALLEAQRREQPDNAVVEFALAQAQRVHGDLEASTASFLRVLTKPIPHRLAWMQQRAREALRQMDGARPARRPPGR